MAAMASGNTFKMALDKSAGSSLGYWQMTPSANISRMLARVPGCDWILLDCEHGDLDDRDMRECVPAIASSGASPIVRIPSTEPWLIKRALDAGAHGILVPLLRTAQEAREIVKAAKFPPMGIRGFGSPYAMDRFNPMPTSDGYLQQANDSLLTLVQIETQSALDNLEEIASVEGIDLLFVGPFDLGNSIGHPIINGEIKPELREAIYRVLEVSHKAGKKCGIYSGSGERAKEYIEAGFDMVHVGSDHTILELAMINEMRTAQGKADGERRLSY
ncbi:hypothetical protein CDV36_007908 [Fusarium kuroshium]|uniref:HpcH/HpaI aldolase/citrate lyase domain-containing protein n=2 Tax=Fusarium solani species complex TaxID=232080 RepID=A0A3M2S598_9HYPO|nr:hypothetical protein CDV36_007908 [Fusarium kuroshium]RSL80440.1 hypothetical protein CEP51_006564 [Fusarium floridanum]